MLKDIDFRKVEDTVLAVIPEDMEGEEAWNAYLINTGSDPIRSVLIASKGYGELDGKPVKTSGLRQFVEEILPGSFVKLEEIREELHPLNNEFWVSFSKENYLFDKKYVFLPETLRKDNLTEIPFIHKKGVMIK